MRHGFYHLHLLQNQAGNLKSLGRKETLYYLEAEGPNISTAWRWAVEHEQVELLKQTVEPLFYLFQRLHELLDLFTFAASRLSDTRPDHQAALGRVLIERAFTLMVLGQREAGLEAAERGLAIVKALNDDEGTLRGLRVLARVKWVYSDFLESKVLAEEGLELARQLASEDYIGKFLELLALVLKEFNDLPDVDQFYRDGLAEIRQLKTDPNALGQYLHQYAFYLLHHGDLHEAQALEQESLGLYIELKYRGSQIGCLDCLGMIAFKLGNLDEAEALYRFRFLDAALPHQEMPSETSKKGCTKRL